MHKSISRRDMLKSLTITAAAGPVMRTIPLQAAEFAHKLIQSEKSSSQTPPTPRNSSTRSIQNAAKTLRRHHPRRRPLRRRTRSRCPRIHRPALERKSRVPAETRRRNHVARFNLRRPLRRRLSRLHARPAKTNPRCNRLQEKRRNRRKPEPGREFFAFLRNLTADGFFTSAIGIEYLGYIGNTYLAEFPGCPPVPES